MAGSSVRLRVFHSKIELIASNGNHVRYLPGGVAEAMVDAGRAAIHTANGKVKSIKLVETAATHARVIGPPGDGRATGVHFTRREVLETSGTRVWAHHPRCTYPDPE